MNRHDEHGSTLSYFVGFVLSLTFTIIPYYLVVNGKFAGNKLLVAILTFAVAQMLIQVFFFLHLGRGRKPLYNVVFLVSTAVAIVVIVSGSMYIMKHLHYNMAPPAETARQLAEDEAIYQVNGQKTGACQAIKQNHQIIIGGQPSGTIQVTSQLCDTLTFVNQTGGARTIIFSKTYAGKDQLTVRKGHNETITLNQTGTYQFYDQNNPSAVGYFTITPSGSD